MLRVPTEGSREPNALAPLQVVRLSERDAVVVKPAGQSSEAPNSGASGTGSAVRTLIEQVRRDLQWPHAQLPHRLDRPTRGLVVVAADAKAVAEHNRAIREHRWTKYYLARVKPVGAGGHGGVAHGRQDPRSLVGEHSCFMRRTGNTARVVKSGGDRADLALLGVAPAPNRAGEWHALIRLDTGRFHQIRAMLAHLGAPLVGDSSYGGAPGSFYLDHALLWLPNISGSGVERVFLEHDPLREELDHTLERQLVGAPARAAIS